MLYNSKTISIIYINRNAVFKHEVLWVFFLLEKIAKHLFYIVIYTMN